MEKLFFAAGITRQSFHQWMQPSLKQMQATPEDMVLNLAQVIQKEFLPGSGAREVYHFIRKHDIYSNKLNGWGKHAFENLCLNNGMRVQKARFKPKTTIRGEYVFPNKIEGLEINDINRVWVSDICYIFNHKGQLIGYATSMMDLYSRLLLGLNFSRNMTAKDTSLAVLEQAFYMRKKRSFPNLFFHSDGGKQYIEKTFIAKLRKGKIESSMADNCYENPFAESFNDTLKNHILPFFKINSFSQLKKKQYFIKKSYNQYKVHSGINRFTPIDYEQHIGTLKFCQRTSLKIKDLN